MKYICECGREFDNPQKFNGHKSHCKKHAYVLDKLDYLIHNEAIRHSKMKLTKQNQGKEIIKLNIKNKKEKWLSEQHKCERCGKIMTEKYGSGRFCSLFCAHSREQLEETKIKIGNSVKIAYKSNPKLINYVNRKNRKYFTSKAERNLLDYLQNNYSDDLFMCGSLTKYKGEILNPDIHSNKLKIIIEYDGIWHFKDIYNQLEHKQHKDNLLLDYVYNSDYRLIRIDEEYKFTYDEIINLIYNDNRKVILLGNRYNYLNIL